MCLRMYLNIRAESWLEHSWVRKLLCFSIGKQDSCYLNVVSPKMYFSPVYPVSIAEMWSSPGSHRQAVCGDSRAMFCARFNFCLRWNCFHYLIKYLTLAVVGILSGWSMVPVLPNAEVSRFQWSWDVNRYDCKTLQWIKSEAEAGGSRGKSKGNTGQSISWGSCRPSRGRS